MQNIIINSIGTAKPSASKLLSESFNLPQEYFLKQLYTAPSLLFTNVDEGLALQAQTVFNQLGLDVTIEESVSDIDFSKELGEISVSIDDISILPTVLNELSDFLGNQPADAFSLLIKEPAIIIGNVSNATAEALQKRTSANICFSNPKKDLYSIFAKDAFPQTDQADIEQICGKQFIPTFSGQLINDLPYSMIDKIWKKHQGQDGLRLINQSHQLVSLELLDFDQNDNDQLQILSETIGIPREILPQIHQNLPVTLFENVSSKTAESLTNQFAKKGVRTKSHPLFPELFRLELSNIQNPLKINKLLRVFFNEQELVAKTTWISPKPVPRLVMRYLIFLLENEPCEIKSIPL